MEITITLFASFRAGRFHSKPVEYPPRTTVANVAAALALADADIGLIIVNGRQVELEQELVAGDQLSLFPLLAGG
jgi:molybdopterin converting factor small subunit